MMPRAQYSQALSVLQRLADANESQAELLRAIQDDLTELRAVKRSALTNVRQVLAAEIECSVFEGHVVPALDIAAKVLTP